MSKIHNLVYDEQQKQAFKDTKELSRRIVLAEHIEYLEWQIQSLKGELQTVIKELNNI
jgi:hypothetical protein